MRRRTSCGGKISYLGGHQYATTVPVTSGSQSQGTRLFLNALFEAQCTTAGGGGGGGADTDGDGVDDASDPFPADPMRCGDSDADQCDDCSSGMFDTANDCDAAGGGGAGGCCDTGSGSKPPALAVLAIVGVLLLRPRKRAGRT